MTLHTELSWYDNFLHGLKLSALIGKHIDNGGVNTKSAVYSYISQRKYRGMALCRVLRKDVPVLVFHGGLQVLAKTVRRADRYS